MKIIVNLEMRIISESSKENIRKEMNESIKKIGKKFERVKNEDINSKRFH